MLYPFPPSRWFEQNTASYLVGWITCYGIVVGLIASIVALWILKPRNRFVWWIAEAFWISSLLAAMILAYPIFNGGPLRDLQRGTQITYWFIAWLALPAIFAGGAELWREHEGCKGFYNPPLWCLSIPCSLFLMSCWPTRESVGPEGAKIHECRTNLKRIGFGMNLFNETFGQFPDSQHEEFNGTVTFPPRSWRVDLLPFLDQFSLYNKYNRNSSWDSPQNSPIATTHLRIYTCPTSPSNQQFDAQKRWYSAYAILVGSDTVFPAGKGLQPSKVHDGLSHTVLAVEACGQQIVWTAPRDITVSEKNLAINLPGEKPGQSPASWSSYHRGLVYTVFADGSVRALSTNTDLGVLRAITTANGGEDPGEF